MRTYKNILVTGGSGFIGSNFIHYLFADTNFDGVVINVDKLTYAGNPENLFEIEKKLGGERYFFENADICDRKRIGEIFNRFEVDCVIHFAAESHVDRSIDGPGEFIKTNIDGTFSLLENARAYWGRRDDVLFHHVSTDEVFGSLGETGYFTEETPYSPRSPYSASKASSDHLVMAYHHTYGLNVTMSNCSNNYGPFQFPEKLIPLMILNMLEDKPLPVYGDGKNVRDWLYVKDHCSGIWAVVCDGVLGSTYNIGGENELDNLSIVNSLCEIVAGKTGRSEAGFKSSIVFVNDRPGHDLRYAIDCSKIKRELKWSPAVDFNRGMDMTVDWYLASQRWIENIKNGEYRNWIEKNYRHR